MTDHKPIPAKSSVPESDELLRAIFESSTDFAIFGMDRRGTVIAWNIGAERLTGYREDEILGRDADILFTPEDRAVGVPNHERATADATGRAEDERWHLRKDGAQFWGSGLLMPLREKNTGYVKILRDRTQQHRAEAGLRESEARFRMLATNIPQLVFRTRSTGERIWGSPQWEVFTGLTDAMSQGFGWMEAVHADDREATLAAWREAQRTGDYLVEHRIRRVADGEYRWHQTRAAPVQTGPTAAAEWVGTSADIHELRGLKDRQQVLLAELQHRTRNLLAIIQAMARRTLRSSPSLEAFAAEFDGRLRALSRVQGLLARTDHKSIDLRELVEAELAALGDQRRKASIEGPPIALPPNSAQALALAIHELATNAVKYGALGQPAGQLVVVWDVEHGAPGRVVLEWRESGVNMPAVEGTPRRGYGSELIERALPYQLGAETRLAFGKDGVRCTIAVPVGAGDGGLA